MGQLSLREVARKVGVSNRAPAHYFKDKAGLLTQFAIEGYELLAESVIESITAATASSGPQRFCPPLAEAMCALRFAIANISR